LTTRSPTETFVEGPVRYHGRFVIDSPVRISSGTKTVPWMIRLRSSCAAWFRSNIGSVTSHLPVLVLRVSSTGRFAFSDSLSFTWVTAVVEDGKGVTIFHRSTHLVAAFSSSPLSIAGSPTICGRILPGLGEFGLVIDSEIFGSLTKSVDRVHRRRLTSLEIEGGVVRISRLGRLLTLSSSSGFEGEAASVSVPGVTTTVIHGLAHLSAHISSHLGTLTRSPTVG
jgi:hypothetical protein